jgi:hypothetical protein
MGHKLDWKTAFGAEMSATLQYTNPEHPESQGIGSSKMVATSSRMPPDGRNHNLRSQKRGSRQLERDGLSPRTRMILYLPYITYLGRHILLKGWLVQSSICRL